LEYPRTLKQQIIKELLDMASFTGKLQDFYQLVGPKIRNDIASMTKNKKTELGNICQHCKEKNELDSAHLHGRSRKSIIKTVLENYKIDNGEYEVPNLHQLITEVKEAHIPIEENFLFLCKKCHLKYDKMIKVNNLKTIKQRNNHSNNKRTNQNIIPQKGEEFTEKEIQVQFNIRNSGGIRPSRKNMIIVLINSYFSEKQGGYENEINENSGFVYHVGEGEEDQKMVRNNKSILESEQNGYIMLYFDKPISNKLIYRFPVKYDSWKDDRQKNARGELRNVIIFKLKIIS